MENLFQEKMKIIEESTDDVMQKINRFDKHAWFIIRKHMRRAFAMGEQYQKERTQQSVQSDGAKWVCPECGEVNVNELRPFCIRCQSPRR
jgi:rubrerythrin